VNKAIESSVLRAAWCFPSLRLVASRTPIILLYHGVPANGDGTFINAAVLEDHIRFLKRHFELIHPRDIAASRKSSDRIRVLLTFDDGFRNNATVAAPILRKYQAPAIFFVCGRHASPGKYLWFSYLQALESEFPGDGFDFRGEFVDMSVERRRSSVAKLRESLLNLTPHPAAMYKAIEDELPKLEDFVGPDRLEDRFAGMTHEQVSALADDSLFDVGAHTVDHPFLTRCDSAESIRQIADNKAWIEQISQTKCNTIAYPSGDYNGAVLEDCRRAGITQGYSVIPKLSTKPELEIARIGIYSTSVDVLGFKIQWGKVLRAAGMKIG
jgi:peptidoglycan/xylan/chitin deacetylase (PgdA/CDA1 family)